MFPRQRIISIFAALVLLLGNAAGWVHVATHHHGRTPCCGSVECAPVVDCVSESVCQTACCDGSDSPFRSRWKSVPDSEPECYADLASNSTCPVDPSKNTPHDSDDCVICQHMLVSRDMALLSPNVQAIWSVELSSTTCSLSDFVVHDFTPTIHFLRGPPSGQSVSCS